MYHFIVNPGSRTGKGQKIWNEIEAELKRRNISYRVYFTEHAGHATEYAGQISAEALGDKKIVFVGGDGTANEVINGLTNLNELTVGYIPTGSGNDLARGLGIPRKPLEALEVVLSSKEYKYFDIGTVVYHKSSKDTEKTSEPKSRRFSVSSGVGYDADICYAVLTSKLKKVLNKIRLGKLIYYLIGIKQAMTNKPAKTIITIDGKEKIEYNKMVFIANMIHRCEGGGLPMGPSADPHDGMLTSCLVEDMSRLRLLLLMPTIFRAKHIKHRGVHLITCHDIRIETDRPMVIHTDGEFGGKHEDISLSCKNKLRFMV